MGGTQKKGKDAMMSGYHMRQYYGTFCHCSAEGCIMTQEWRKRNTGRCNDEVGNVIMWVHLEKDLVGKGHHMADQLLLERHILKLTRSRSRESCFITQLL